MTEMPVFTIPPASAHGLALALDCARAEAGARSWIARFEDAALMSRSERLGRAVLAAAHGASGAQGPSGDSLVAPGSELDEAIRVVARDDGADAIVLLPRAQRPSGTLTAWHRSAWEAGYSPRILRLSDEARSARVGSARLAILDRRAGRSLVDSMCEQGLQVIWDGSAEDEPPRFADSGIVVHRISRAQRAFLESGGGAPPSGGGPGPLLRDVSALLRRAMDLLGDPAPAPRTLNASPPPLRSIGASAQLIASLPDASGPAITREPIASGGLWRISAHLDAATRRGLLALVAAVARLAPPHPEMPDGVECARRSGALLLFNHGDRARELSAIIGRDAVSGSECTGHALLGPASAMLVVGAGEDPRRRA